MAERAANMASVVVGGVGQGPSLNYEIKTEQFTMNNHSGRDAGIHILHRAVALEALHDSAESFSQPRCHPETRKKLLKNLYDWATDPHSKYSILWLHGPAGAGKSAIMQTLCRRLQDAGRLGGGFFFKRGHATRGNAKMLFATLAYQLALHQPQFTGPISRTIETNPSLLGRSLDMQLWNLILEPCKLIQDATPSVLLVDGLDECESHNIQREILRLIASAINGHGVPLRILVASRPEPHLRETFDEESIQGLFDSVNIEQSFEDVRTYLRYEFSRVHRQHSTTMQQILTPWPSPKVLEMLVQDSSGYFIYASTVIRFVDDEYSRPSQQLNIIIQNLVPHDTESPFAALDHLYRQILSGVPARHHPILCDILGVVMHYPNRQEVTTGGIEELLGLGPGEVGLILRPLHSVLKLPSEKSPFDQEPIRAHHASFRDFLDSHERASIFYLGSPQHRAKKLACLILKSLAYKYEDPQKNRRTFWLCQGLSMNTLYRIQYMVSVAPSPDFVPLIRLFNPDFVLCNLFNSGGTENFLGWLTQINPVPEDLIKRWDDYRFIAVYGQVQRGIAAQLLMIEKRNDWWPQGDYPSALCPVLSRMSRELRTMLVSCRELMAQSPQLFRIFQARQLIFNDGDVISRLDLDRHLFQLRIVLDLSWEEIRVSICSLRPLVSQEWDIFFIIFLFMPAICEELESLSPRSMISRDLACGYLRLMPQIANGDLPMFCWGSLSACREWGRHIRSSPQSNPELLEELIEFCPPWDIFSEWNKRLEPVEFHDVVQWLKASPNPRPDLIDRWQGYLRESMDHPGMVYTDEELEKRWKDNLAREASFHGPPQESDEEVIRYWEACISELTNSGCGGEDEEEASGDEDWYSASSGEGDINEQ
ncbi:putative nwd2 protein [Mycena venus]|uniref:Putative nwd2 protein n=1 Tax=Mycena venus TaxID=2733690 RepID=A0A8H7CQ74_9AGAR|nr:putative nwd2 protein [Mycena venus]